MKDSRYFFHDSNARHDPKIAALVQLHGLEAGYRFWCLIEVLREQADYRINIGKHYNRVALQRELHCGSVDEVGIFLRILIDMELLEDDGEYIISRSLAQRMERLDGIRSVRSEAGKRGRAKQLGTSTTSTSIFGQSPSKAQTKFGQSPNNAHIPAGQSPGVAGHISTYLPINISTYAQGGQNASHSEEEEGRSEEEITSSTEATNEPSTERMEVTEDLFCNLPNGTQFTLPEGEKLHGVWFQKVASNLFSMVDDERTTYAVDDPQTVVAFFAHAP